MLYIRKEQKITEKQTQGWNIFWKSYCNSFSKSHHQFHTVIEHLTSSLIYLERERKRYSFMCSASWWASRLGGAHPSQKQTTTEMSYNLEAHLGHGQYARYHVTQ